MADKRNNYWVCIIGSVDRDKLPEGFDSLLKAAAIKAVATAGIKVENCWSG